MWLQSALRRYCEIVELNGGGTKMKANAKLMAAAVIIAAAYNTSVKSENVENNRAAKYALADMKGEL